MPPFPACDLEPIYAGILDGRLGIVGWGAVAALPLHRALSPFPVAFVVDSDPARWGTTIGGVPVVPPDALREAGAVALVVLPHYAPDAVRDILARAAAIGSFPTLPPYREEIDGATVRALVAARPPRAGEPPALTHARAALERSTPAAAAALVRAAAGETHPPPVAGRARLVVGALRPGGAERQLCHLAVGLRRRGWEVGILTQGPTRPGAEHYEDAPRAAGVAITALPDARALFSDPRAGDAALAAARAAAPVLSRVPFHLVHWVLAFRDRFLLDRPELVVAYLDPITVTAGLGALLAGVPRVLLSGRNVHPGHFPDHYAPIVDWMRDGYRLLADLPQIRLSANSAAGARSYASWLELPAERVRAIPNGIPPDQAIPPPPDRIAAARAEFGAADGRPLIVGVFRLSPEKRPALFVETLRRSRAAGAEFRAVLVGDGPMTDEIRAETARAGLSETLTLAGPREDARTLIAAADLVLHTARVEGHPNVLMEAQLLGRPIVATEAGGAREVLAPAHQGRLIPTGDAAALARAVVEVLADLDRARAGAATASAWVAEAFSIDRLVDATLAGAGMRPRR